MAFADRHVLNARAFGDAVRNGKHAPAWDSVVVDLDCRRIAPCAGLDADGRIATVGVAIDPAANPQNRLQAIAANRIKAVVKGLLKLLRPGQERRRKIPLNWVGPGIIR